MIQVNRGIDMGEDTYRDEINYVKLVQGLVGNAFDNNGKFLPDVFVLSVKLFTMQSKAVATSDTPLFISQEELKRAGLGIDLETFDFYVDKRE